MFVYTYIYHLYETQKINPSIFRNIVLTPRETNFSSSFFAAVYTVCDTLLHAL